MRKKALLLLWILIPVTACNSEKKETQDHRMVTVSILPEAYFVSQIAGDKTEVSVMIPPGANPATYEPTPRQLQDLTGSSVYLKIGYSAFESAWMDRITSINPAMKVTDLSRNIGLIEEEHEHGGEHLSVNPHVWLSPGNARIIAANVAADLSVVWPEDSAFYRKNLDLFLDKLDTLESVMHSELDSLPNKAFMIYHPALSYLARDFGLEQFALEVDGKEPSPAHMKHLADIAKEKKIGVIFLQMQFDQHNAEALSRETGAKIVQINPLDPEWYEQMLFITSALKTELQ